MRIIKLEMLFMDSIISVSNLKEQIKPRCKFIKRRRSEFEDKLTFEV